MVLSDLIIESLKTSIGLVIGFHTDNDYYFEGEVLACDGIVLKYNDRKTGVRLIQVSKIKEVYLK